METNNLKLIAADVVVVVVKDIFPLPPHPPRPRDEYYCHRLVISRRAYLEQ